MSLSFTELMLPSTVLAELSLPAMPYEVPTAYARHLPVDPSRPPLDAMLFALQHRAAHGQADWARIGEAIDRLALLLCAEISPPELEIDGADWWIGLGKVNLYGDVLTVQRDESLVAAFERREDGRLRTAVYQPLCARAIEKLTGLGLKPDPEHGVAMRADNWEYAGDCAALNGNAYAAMDGRAYLSGWHKGVGTGWDGTDDVPWIIAREAARPRLTGLVATEVKVFRRFADLLEQLPPCEPSTTDKLPQAYALAPVQDRTGEEEHPPAPLSSYDLSTEAGRLGFFAALFNDFQEDGLLPAVNHVWESLGKPRGARCALMAQRVGKSGIGKRALVRFIKRFLDEVLYEFDVPDLPVRADYASFEEWNTACFAMFTDMDERLSRLLARYEAILDGRSPDAVQEAPTGVVIKGPWGRRKPMTSAQGPQPEQHPVRRR